MTAPVRAGNSAPVRAGNFSASPLALPGVLLLSARRFGDARGHLFEVFSARDFATLGITVGFVQDNQSLSLRAGTVRGLHHQAAPAAQVKLVRVIRGAILDVAVDLRRSSPSFGQHVAVTLDAEAGEQLFIPAGFAHGFCTLQDATEVTYKVSTHYEPSLDRAIAWNDPAIGIDWPVAAEAAQLSDKDRAAPRLADAPDLPA